MATSMLDKDSKKRILNAIYQKKHILKIFGTTPNQYKRYLELDCIKASVRKSPVQGQANLYSFDDLMKIFHFLLLLEIDIKVKVAAKIIINEQANNFPMCVWQVYADRDAVEIISANIKLDPAVATETLCERIFKSIKLDELQQRVSGLETTASALAAAASANAAENVAGIG